MLFSTNHAYTCPLFGKLNSVSKRSGFTHTLPDVKASKLAFKQMENVSKFLVAIKAFGVPDSLAFVTQDLFEGTQTRYIVTCLTALRAKAEASGFKI